ncbi:uncharacterized protein LOC135501659 [Lineus longissimus]|uniref:uncharacterized protein LOC135501659 n=1 Tax=Lineus longissimus TaxID=88925 RepID=UPI002B4D04B5
MAAITPTTQPTTAYTSTSTVQSSTSTPSSSTSTPSSSTSTPSSTTSIPSSSTSTPSSSPHAAETILIIAAAVPSCIAFILAIALITVIACWCRSRRRAKLKKKRKKKTSVAVSLETLEDARSRSLREAQASRLQMLQDGAKQLGYTNPLDIQNDEFYQNIAEDEVKARFHEMEQDAGGYVNVERNELLRGAVPVQDDGEDYEHFETKGQVSAPIQVPVQNKSENSDDEKDEHDYVNVPKGVKPGQSVVKKPVLARVLHMLADKAE